ncbi:hypothetical protein CHELA1G11_11057 [Hyphomicrobiales bacterium]|nr:hypothetical protein CHELA1G11_11057 [Hyphomicrobiales bacterium]CAH1670417.1 hypothetical protein CHELA1G2_13250 [Hyphomicrobiales bacterium]
MCAFAGRLSRCRCSARHHARPCAACSPIGPAITSSTSRKMARIRASPSVHAAWMPPACGQGRWTSKRPRSRRSARWSWTETRPVSETTEQTGDRRPFHQPERSLEQRRAADQPHDSGEDNVARIETASRLRRRVRWRHRRVGGLLLLCSARRRHDDAAFSHHPLALHKPSRHVIRHRSDDDRDLLALGHRNPPTPRVDGETIGVAITLHLDEGQHVDVTARTLTRHDPMVEDINGLRHLREDGSKLRVEQIEPRELSFPEPGDNPAALLIVEPGPADGSRQIRGAFITACTLSWQLLVLLQHAHHLLARSPRPYHRTRTGFPCGSPLCRLRRHRSRRMCDGSWAETRRASRWTCRARTNHPRPCTNAPRSCGTPPRRSASPSTSM